MKAASFFGAIFVASCFLVARQTECAEVNVGGIFGWRPGVTYDVIHAVVGDILVFRHGRGAHNVIKIPDGRCDANATGVPLQPIPTHPDMTALPLDSPGLHHFSTPGVHHCEDGMIVTVNVTAGRQATTGRRRHPSAARLRYSAEGDGSCSMPLAVPGSPRTWTISCLSARWRMKPGEVITSFRRLPNAYPGDRVIAVVNQQARVVGKDGRPVPQSELFVRHFFSDTRFVLGLGTDIRGSMMNNPLPLPYTLVVNTSIFNDPALRFAKITLINALDVRETALQRCLECWCPHHPTTSPATGGEASGKLPAQRGGLFCCSSANCPVADVHPRPARVYHLQLNLTFRVLAEIEDSNLIPVHQHLLDVAGGAMEYDVLHDAPGNTYSGGDAVHAKQSEGPVDARCPQTSDFSLVRCVAHQHPGGACVELHDVDSGQLICQSCPVYGSGQPDEAGNEGGFIVRMVPKDLLPPYRFKPGQRVRLTSKYNAAEDHYGVMGLLVMYLADWDVSCPGDSDGNKTAFGPTHEFSGGTEFGFAHPDGAI